MDQVWIPHECTYRIHLIETHTPFFERSGVRISFHCTSDRSGECVTEAVVCRSVPVERKPPFNERLSRN